MVINHNIEVKKINQSGFSLFKQTWKPFFKYALLSTFVSFVISIYIAIFDTFFSDSEVIYISGLVLLLLMYFPVVYFSIRLTMTHVLKLKYIIENRTFDYKAVFSQTKIHFWKVFGINVIRFLLKGAAIVSITLPILYVHMTILQPYRVVTLTLPLQIGYGILCVAILITSAYFLIRLEFATLLVYWDIKTEVSEMSASMEMTQKKLIDKMKVMFIGHIPSLVISFLSMLYVFHVTENMTIWIRWAYIGVSILMNTSIFSWMYAFYYPLFEKMLIFKSHEKIVKDEQGIEWLTY